MDVAIIGAGAAGIAAARRIAEAKRSFRLIEAGRRIGGRCVTDTTPFGMPFDLGAHWIHAPDDNPLAKLSPAGLDVYAAPRGLSARVGPRDARDAELERLLAAMVNTRRAFADAAQAKADMSALQALPADLGAWRDTIAFIDGPFACGKDLAEVSAVALGRIPERDNDAFCRQGYGTLLANLGAGLPVQLGNPVSRVAWGSGLAINSPRGTLRGARGHRHRVDQHAHLRQDRVQSRTVQAPVERRRETLARQLRSHRAGNPGQSAWPVARRPGVRAGARHAHRRDARQYVGHRACILVEVAGSFGRDLSAQGTPAMVEFARDWLASLFGNGIKSKIKRSHATRWNAEPWALGAMSAPAPGADAARAVLMEPLGGRVWFAGEALHATKWGTVEGAWESGEHAADAVLRHLGARKEEKPQKPARHSRRPRRRRH